MTIKLPFGIDFSSSALIRGLSVICKLCDGSFLLLETEPVITVLVPNAFEIISAVSDVGAKPPAIVIWQLS